MDDIGVPVDLYIYDLSQGMARLMSNSLLGRQIDGVWHTSIVAYGREYFFGGDGIQSCSPGTIEVLQNPTKIERIGETFLPYQVFVDYIHGLGNSTFRGETYNLLKHNCNNFSNELATFLCGNGIPKYILDLPDTILNSNLNPALLQILNSISTSAQSAISVNGIRHHRQESPDFLQLNNQIEEARQQSIALEERRSNLNEKLARKERKKEKKKKKLQKEHSRLGLSNSSELSDLSNSGFDGTNTSSIMAEAAAAETEATTLSHDEEPSAPPQNSRAPAETILQLEAEERREEEERKRLREPPIVFKDLEANDTFDKLVEVLGNVELSSDEQQSLDELHQYLVLGEGSWALGDNFLLFVGRIFRDKSLDSQVRVRLLRALAACALRDDIILLLHQDRREHTLMNHAYGIDQAPVEEQTAMALFLCNMFENLSSSEWLLYISEWPLGNQQISNIRSTTKVAVHSLLSEDPTLKDVGSAIIHNLACKEVFDDVAVELAMAILQHLSSKPAEEQLFRCLKALARFCQVSGQDVPQLIQMIGPPPSSFKGASPRIDEQIELISRKLR